MIREQKFSNAVHKKSPPPQFDIFLVAPLYMMWYDSSSKFEHDLQIYGALIEYYFTPSFPPYSFKKLAIRGDQARRWLMSENYWVY